MSIPIFKEFNKPAKDVLTRDYPTSYKLELKTIAQNGVNFEVYAEQKDGKFIFGTLKPKFVSVKYDLELVGEFTSDNLFKGDLTAKDLLPGLKTKLHAETGDKHGESGIEQRDKVGVELTYNHEVGTIHGDFSWMLDKDPFVTISGVVAHDAFSAGVSSSFKFGNESGPTEFAGGLGFKKDSYNITLLGTGKWQKKESESKETKPEHSLAVDLKGNFHYKVDDNLTVAYEATYDCSKASIDNITSTVGGIYTLDSSSSVKAKFNQAGALSLAYANQLNKYAKIQLGTEIDTLKAQNHKYGLTLTISG